MYLSWTIYFFILGAVLASFYGVVASRLPNNKSIIKPRSHCDHCNHRLKPWELIPIISYIILRGKCHKCQQKIGIDSFLTEIAMAILFSLSFYHYGFSYNFFVSLILISLLFLIFMTDMKYMIILDSPLVIASILIFILKWLYFDLKTALLSLLSGLGLFLLMLLIGYLGSKIAKREALGGGDIKLSFVIGASLGIPHSLMALVLSSFLALPYATISLFISEKREVPYGPFLVSALLIVFLFYDKFSNVLNLFSL